MTDFLSFTPCYDDAEDSEQTQEIGGYHAPDFYENALVSYEEDSKAAARDESARQVNQLLALASAEAVDLYDYMAANVERIESNKRKPCRKHARYAEIFHAVARLALERKAPALFASWLTGIRTDEMRERIGAEIKARLRPAQIIIPRTDNEARKAARNANAALTAAGLPVKRGRPRKIT